MDQPSLIPHLLLYLPRLPLQKLSKASIASIASQTFKPKMCKQTYTTCRNIKCDGISQMREIHPCDNRPNCETELILVKRSKKSTVVYCPNCQDITPKQRKGQLSKAWHAADAARSKGGSTKAQGRSKRASTKAQGRSKRASTKAQGGNAEDSADGEVEKQEAESSTFGRSRGDVDGNLSSESDDYFTTLEETEERFLLPEEDSSMRSKLLTIFQNRPGTSEEAPSKNSYPVVTYGLQGTNADAISPDSNDAPRSVASFLARVTRQSLLYGNPADTMRYFVPTTTSQFPAHSLSTSQIPIDPILLEIDAACPRGGFYQEHARS